MYFKAAGHASTIIPVGPEPRPLLFSHESRLLELLASVVDPQVWSAALRGHARVQRGYLGRTDRLLGPNRITELLDPADRDRLAILAPSLHALVAELAALGVPETLTHSDLHARNVAVRDGHPTVFDWTDAAVAHPFLDLVTFFQHGWGLSGGLAVAERLQSDYLDEWSGVLDPETLTEAYALAQRLAPVHQAVSYLHLVDSVSGVSREGTANGGVHWLTTLLRS